MINVCTIIARNYLPHARVLGESLLENNPESSFAVLVVDDRAGAQRARSEPFRMLRLSDIGLDSREIGRLAGIYDVTELSTAVKPIFLQWLLAEGVDHMIYLDPDIKVYGSLQEAVDLALTHGIVLTPHTTVPIPRDGRRVGSANILASGVFNLGFLAVRRNTTDFLAWWWEQTRRDALSDVAQMMFTDQRWIDLVPCMFNHAVLRSSAYNVAYWNLHGRRVIRKDGRYLVDGEPLRFFHFSGFDLRKPYLLSKHQLDLPRILLSEHPAVARLCEEYVESLVRHGARNDSGIEYGWATLPSGIRLDSRIRRLYRSALVEAEKALGPEPPNPFDVDHAAAFVDWLNQPVAPRVQPVISRYLYSIYEDRPDLQRAFADLPSGGSSAFLRWALDDGRRQVPIPDALLPTVSEVERAARPSLAQAGELTPGVNLVGYLKTVTGVGEHARLLAQSLEAQSIPFSTITVGGTLSREDADHVERGSRRAPHDVNLICVNADQTPVVASQLGRAFFDGRYNVGYWAWELEQLPSWMYAAFEPLDEVWGASRFVTEAVAAANRKPAYKIPYPFVQPRYRSSVTKSDYGLPDRFMFLFIFDFLSVFERKNPLALVKAFERAFSASDEPFLAIKTINGDKRLNDLERLRARVSRLPNVVLLEDYFSAERKNGLLAVCDCYVSLHRSEGTGITMAEAMSLGKPVIATAYSGNLDFMNDRNSYLVDYVKSEVPPGCDPYPAGQSWADPSVDHAAASMRQVVERREDALQRGARAQQDILTKHNVAECGLAIAARLQEIRRLPRAGTPAGASIPIAPAPGQSPVAVRLARAAELARPTAGLPPSANLRGLRLRAQRLLFRALRPYWWGQQQATRTLVDAVRDLETGLLDQMSSIRKEIGSLQSTMVHASSLEALESKLGSLDQATSGFQAAAATHLEALTEVVSRVEISHAETTAAHASSLETLESRLGSLGQATSGFQAAAATHLAALTEVVARVEIETKEINQRLYPIPYMSDPALFRYRDQAGRGVLGFQTRLSTRGNYLGFEDIFRGSEDLIRERFRCYLPLFKESGVIIDIGCGRGEFLELLRERALSAVGVDLDADMVRQCREKGLDVHHGDGIEYLQSREDSSLGAIVAMQVIEHLTEGQVHKVFDLAVDKLRPGGLLIAETVNPHSLEALKGFWVDLSHRHPIFPEVALVQCWLRPFASAYVLFPHGSGDFEADRKTQGEYAVIARKAETAL